MRKTLPYLSAILVIGIIIYLIFGYKPKPPKPSDNDYITDTVYIKIPYEVPKPYPVPTKPKEVKIFTVDSTALDSLKLILQGKDILIEGLSEEIKISQYYLKQFPKNPKLLSLSLSRDSLNLSLLNITGIPQETSWPVHLNENTYLWDNDNGLTSKPFKEPKVKEPFTMDYFIGGGFNVLYPSPYISGTISHDWARIRLYGTTELGLLRKESSSIKFGVDYRLNGKNRN